MKLAIGVDIGGSHISCAACDMDEKKYLSQTHCEQKLDNKASIKEITAIWGEAIRKTMQAAGVDKLNGIGFAMPGPFEYHKGISRMTSVNDKYENIYGMDVPKELRNYLKLPPSFPIRFINDATAFALGEDWLGKAKGSNSSLSITLGTGFGSAFIINGIPVVEGELVPKNGCVWHLPFENGIGDDYFSTRGFLNRYEKISGQRLKGVKELAALAKHQMDAKSLFDDFGYKLGLFLFPWIQKTGTEVLVIGGNIANAFPLFETELKNYFSSLSFPLRIELSELGEKASIIGSAVLTDESFYQKVKPLLHLM